MPIQYIYKICHCTDGLAANPDPEDPGEYIETECPVCKGTGKVLWGYLQDELEGEE